MDKATKKTTKQEQKIAAESLVNLIKNQAVAFENTSDVITLKIQGHEGCITVPKKAFEMLIEILSHMSEGKAVSLILSDTEISTQKAADMLHVSRPHVVKLLEQGVIPYKKVGTHRRVLLEDVIEYEAKAKKQREKSLKFLAKQAQDLNLGYE